MPSPVFSETDSTTALEISDELRFSPSLPASDRKFFPADFMPPFFSRLYIFRLSCFNPPAERKEARIYKEKT